MVDAEDSEDEFVELVDDRRLLSGDEWVDANVMLMTSSGEQQCLNVEKLDGGITVYPEVGVYVSVDEVTGQCLISSEHQTASDDARRMDLEKLASVECSEISSLTGYVTEILMQPAEMWLAYTDSNTAQSDPALNVLARYVDAVSAEPLDYWLCPVSEVEFPHVNEASFEDVVATSTSHIWLEAECDVAWITSCIHQILCKPDSFWLVSCHDISEGVALNLSFDVPDIDVVSNHTPPQCSAYAFLPQSSTATEVVVNGTSVNSCQSEYAFIGLDSVTFSNDAYFGSLASKPVNYWLCGEHQKLPTFN